MSTIAEGTVVLIERGGVYKPFTLKKSKKVSVARLGSFYPDGALGLPYGSRFEVVRDQLVPLSGRSSTKVCAVAVGSQLDNRAVFDDGTAQVLSHQDIADMRESGCSGEGIVESVIEHSRSFKDKTKFSQEKYVRKKEEKHVPVIRIIRPSTRLLCELYYLRGSSNMYHLRADTVAQILTHANIRAHSAVLVMETCQSLLVGALLERMGGFGKLVQVFFGDFPVRLALDNFSHLSEADRAILLEYPLQTIAALRSSHSTPQHTTAQPAALREEGDTTAAAVSCTTDEQGEGSNAVDDSTPPSSKAAKIEELPSQAGLEGESCERSRKYGEAEELLRSFKMDGLVIASRFHPAPLLMTLVHFLASSRPFVVYSHLLDPLVDCYKQLKESGLAYNIQISDTWSRHYQVLPERTHPEVNMDAQSGYLLTGTTVHAQTTL